MGRSAYYSSTTYSTYLSILHVQTTRDVLSNLDDVKDDAKEVEEGLVDGKGL